MAIERIGKGGALPPTPETPDAGAAKAGAAAPFKVERTEAPEAPARAGAVDAPAPATPLARLRAGEIDVHGYVDLTVENATSSLKGLPAEELEAIKSVLRDQALSDPGLADLVRTATGKMPTPPED